MDVEAAQREVESVTAGCAHLTVLLLDLVALLGQVHEDLALLRQRVALLETQVHRQLEGPEQG